MKWGYTSALLMVFLCFGVHGFDQSQGVTFNFPSRFGDYALTCAKAKYVSMKYGLPFYYRRFDYPKADGLVDLMISKKEKLLTKDLEESFAGKITILNEADLLNHQHKKSTLFIIDFCFIPNDIPIGVHEHAFSFDIVKWLMVENKQLEENFREIMALAHKKVKLDRPLAESITVAVHIRKPSWIDSALDSKQYKIPLNDRLFPFKFPPEYFYVEQIKRLSSLVDYKPLYVMLFTDDQAPSKILERLSNHLSSHKNISLYCARNDGNWLDTTFDELHKMTKYDCLIRSASNFAGVAQVLADYKVIFGPKMDAFHWDGDLLICDQTYCYFYDKNAHGRDKFKRFVYEKENLDAMKKYAQQALGI